LLKKLEDGNIKEDQSKHIDGIICGILTDPANAEKVRFDVRFEYSTGYGFQ
jgi:hypothetical protein